MPVNGLFPKRATRLELVTFGLGSRPDGVDARRRPTTIPSTHRVYRSFEGGYRLASVGVFSDDFGMFSARRSGGGDERGRLGDEKPPAG